MKIPIDFPQEPKRTERGRAVEPREARLRLSCFLNNLCEGSMVTVEREEIEMSPENGWRRFKAANKITLQIHPPPPAST